MIFTYTRACEKSQALFFFCPFVFFIGNVAHKSHYNVVAFIVNNGQLNIFLVFRQINAPVANGASALQHVEKHCRIQHADDLVSQNISRVFNVHNFTCGAVDLLDLQLLVQHKDTVWCIFDNIVGK